SGSFHEECRMTSSSPHLTVPEQENESDCGSEGTLQKLRSRSVANSRQDSQQSLYGVMYRQDILYSRSLTNLPQNKSNLKINCSSSVRLSEGDEQDNQSKKYVVCGFIPCSKEARDAYKEMMDLSLLADPVFLLFTVSNFCTSIGFNVPYVYIKDKALESGVDSTTASALIAWIGGANTVSRVILGYISDSPKINRLFLYNSALTICGFSTILSSFCFDYTSLAVYACVFGATAGAYVGLTSVILVDLLGLEKLTNAFGLLLLFQGIASLIGPPIGGMLFDISGSYDLCFYGAGSMIAASGLMLFFVPCLQKRSNANLDSIKARAITSQANDTEKVQFFVGTLSLKALNHIYVLDYDEDSNTVGKKVYSFKNGEVWGLKSLHFDQELLAVIFNSVEDSSNSLKAGVFRIPNSEFPSIPIAENSGCVETVSLFDTHKIGKNVRSLEWHPTNGSEAVMAVDANLIIWSMATSSPT
ncbi:hypothetical protein QYM36_016861, partial [Artemia franciscana]